MAKFQLRMPAGNALSLQFFIMYLPRLEAYLLLWVQNQPNVTKLLQSICCFYGILTLIVIYLILNKFPLSDFSKLISFGFICFLPRHIYMCAMHSNDTMAYLFVAICIYVLIINIERQFPLRSLMLLSLVITITIFIKYNTLIIIPVVLVVFIFWVYQSSQKLIE